MRRIFGLDLPTEEWGREEGIDEAGIRERLLQATGQHMAAKAANIGPDLMRFIEKSVLLQTLDAVWKEHLLALDYLRQGIGLRAYGQRDPLNEYKSEAFALFNAMLDDMRERVTSLLARVEVGPEIPSNPPPLPYGMVESHPDPSGVSWSRAGAWRVGRGDVMLAEPIRVATAPKAEVDPNDTTTWRNTPRNAPCPCGSGKKYKHCHGRSA